MRIKNLLIGSLLAFPVMAAALTPAEVQTWSKTAAIASYTYDYKNADTQINKIASTYFTPEGGKAFKDALEKSGNLKTIRDNKLTVTAEIKGEPKIISEKDNAWEVKVPMVINYTPAEKDKFTTPVQTVMVTMQLSPMPSNPKAVGIQQLLVEAQGQPMQQTLAKK